MGGFQTGQTGIDFIDYYRQGQTIIDGIDIYRWDGLYRLDRHLQTGWTLQTGQTSYRQNKLLQTRWTECAHEAGQAAEETRHMLVEMLKIQQYEDF